MFDQQLLTMNQVKPVTATTRAQGVWDVDVWDSDIQWCWQALSAHQKYQDQPGIPCQVT